MVKHYEFEVCKVSVSESLNTIIFRDYFSSIEKDERPEARSTPKVVASSYCCDRQIILYKIFNDLAYKESKIGITEEENSPNCLNLFLWSFLLYFKIEM